MPGYIEPAEFEFVYAWNDCAKKSKELLNAKGELLASLNFTKGFAEDRNFNESFKEVGLNKIFKKSWRNSEDSISYFFVFKKK